MTILWQDPYAAGTPGGGGKKDKHSKDADHWDTKKAQSMLLPTWDESAVLDLTMTYPRDSPSRADPNGFVYFTGNPHDGVRSRLWVQPMPASGVGINSQWPPMACDPPMPLPPPVCWPPPMERSSISAVEHVGFVPAPLLAALWEAQPIDESVPEGKEKG